MNEFKDKLRDICKLSNKIKKNDNRKILAMMKEHVDEIQELYDDKNEHWTIETAPVGWSKIGLI